MIKKWHLMLIVVIYPYICLFIFRLDDELGQASFISGIFIYLICLMLALTDCDVKKS